METRYRYTGPLSAVTLAGGRDVLLAPGAEVTLPDDNAYVKALVARKHLTVLGAVNTAATAAVGTATVTAATAAASTTSTTTTANAAGSGTAPAGAAATGAANGS